MTFRNSSLGISNTIGMAFIGLPLFERGGRGQGQLVRCLPNKSRWDSEAEDVEVERNLWFKIATHTGNSSHAWQLAGRQEAKKKH